VDECKWQPPTFPFYVKRDKDGNHEVFRAAPGAHEWLATIKSQQRAIAFAEDCARDWREIAARNDAKIGTGKPMEAFE
jgi:hypothetical protein